MTKRCIFCKNDSSGSRSIEHILPESLGNKEHLSYGHCLRCVQQLLCQRRRSSQSWNPGIS
ncbi:MAG TPA: HNH endonuclease [Candidatus Angelobacter sp.]|nr:HNH endonuclease [Candidatus Angelobacter sp.]